MKIDKTIWNDFVSHLKNEVFSWEVGKNSSQHNLHKWGFYVGVLRMAENEPENHLGMVNSLIVSTTIDIHDDSYNKLLNKLRKDKNVDQYCIDNFDMLTSDCKNDPTKYL